MKTRILRKLTPLASEFLQTRFVRGATAEEYILPEDILNDAYECLRFVSEEPVGAAGIDDDERSAVLGLEHYLDRIPSTDDLDPEALIAREEWREARRRSAQVIALLGGDLSALEQTLDNQSKPNKARLDNPLPRPESEIEPQ